MLYFCDLASRSKKHLQPGIEARTFWGEQIMLAVVELDANAILPPHSHPQEQGGLVLEGEVEFTIAGETRLARPGDLYIIPGDVEHSVKVGPSPARLLDIFSPIREELK